jgi:hypothetical protein
VQLGLALLQTAFSASPRIDLDHSRWIATGGADRRFLRIVREETSLFAQKAHSLSRPVSSLTHIVRTAELR